MKKLLLLLALCLALASCSSKQTKETDPTVSTTIPPEEIVTLYDSQNPVEVSTNSAVRAYPLLTDDCVSLIPMGDKLLVVGNASLTVVQGDLCEVVAQIPVDAELSSLDLGISASDTGVCYYDKENNQVVMLNPRLQQSSTYPLPKKTQGAPAIYLPGQTAYFCEGQELRALDLQTGISRMIRTFNEGKVEITGLHFDGTALSCLAEEEDRTTEILISTENGQSIYDGLDLLELQSGNGYYYAKRTDGPFEQNIIGTLETQAQSLNLSEEEQTLVTAFSLNGMVTYAADDSGLQLAFYSLESGLKTSTVTLENVKDPVAVLADIQYVWIVAAEDGKQVLYRWDIELTTVEDEASYIGNLYTNDNPNLDGIGLLKERIQTINETYGVGVLIWDDAMNAPGNYDFEPEHNVEAISEKLDELEDVLSQFPEGFLKETVKGGSIKICLVRSIISGEESVQYWANKDCYVAISVGVDVKEAFLLGASYAIDSHVMGNSRDFDTWNKLNPSDFTYGQEINEAYLTGETRAFVDAQSMISPYEDRSHIIAWAMMEGNADLFASETMQAKLLRACEGIREAYGLEKSPETYIWEQYLNKSLAYTN